MSGFNFSPTLDKVQMGEIELSIRSDSNILIPECIGTFIHLQALCIDAPIDKLPDNISNLKSLYWIELHNTLLTELPTWIIRMENLSFISLKGSNINKLPIGLGSMPCLETLYLKGTKVNHLPHDLANSSSINSIGIDAEIYYSLDSVTKKLFAGILD